ncbi:MAG: DNA repair protein RecO [Phycisphaerales bacterium]|nr:DNA repair protein RecO [Phycisphaerales bacterium]
MPTIRDQGVCVRVWDFSETSQTVSVFTREHGVIRAIAKGAKRDQARFSGGLELLTRAEFGAIVKSTASLATMTYWDLQDGYFAIRRSLDAFYAALYGAELVVQMIHDHDPHRDLFDALLVMLGTCGTSPRGALLRFQWATLVEAGYRPDLTRDVVTGGDLEEAPTYAFLPHRGGLTREGTFSDGSPVWRVRAETVDRLRGVAEPDTAGKIDAASDDITIERANRLLASYVREIIGHEPSAMRAWFDRVRRDDVRDGAEAHGRQRPHDQPGA